MKIIIPIRFRNDAWLGGSNYFLSLVNVLRNHTTLAGHTIYLLSNRPELLGESGRNNVEIISSPWLEPKSGAVSAINGALDAFAHFNPRMHHFAKSVRADLITHSIPRIFSPCKTVFWMPDFQHCSYPQYFSAGERNQRNTAVSSTSRAGHILLSSHSAAKDFRRFFPELFRVQTHVLQFTPLIGENAANTVDSGNLRTKYRLPEKYFFLPNQFWQHKNHLTVIEALHLLPDEYQVVCTGALDDYRFAEHMATIHALLEKYSLQERFRILGVVPRDEMITLMRESISVINPSLFEGWSTTVEEAKYMGKRLILSDIEVHCEQAPQDAIFFDAKDASALADSMKTVASQFDPETEAARQMHARANYQDAMNRFGSQYLAIAQTIISSR
ncbi:MAG: glycosyltransferase family 4 protein [Arenimonas sp.]